jgi:hypothetical protein
MHIVFLATALMAMDQPGENPSGAKRLAELSMLHTVREAITANDTEELVKEHPSLTPAEVRTLRSVAAELWAIEKERLTHAMAQAYAAKLTAEEISALVAFYESPVGARERAVTPAVMSSVATLAGEVDFKDLTQATFCRRTGKACLAVSDD